MAAFSVFFSFSFFAVKLKKNQIMEVKRITHPSSRSNMMFMGSKDSRKTFLRREELEQLYRTTT